MEAISLFSGAGGMDVGIKNAGFDVVVANELDISAAETYEQNHTSSKMIRGDINENINELSQYSGVDLVFGGPPCQGFSVAGRMDLEDPRSQLIFKFCEVVENVKPKAFIMENVKSLATLEKFRDFRESFYRRMTEAGYNVSTHILNAKDFGIAQSRERVFFIGILPEFRKVPQNAFDKYKEGIVTLRDVISHLGPAGSDSNPYITNAKITLAKSPVLRKSPYAGMLFNGQGRPLNPDSWSGTLPASMGGNRTPIIDESHLYDDAPSWVEAYHYDLIRERIKPRERHLSQSLRRLTFKEAALLQSFPEDYFFGSKSMSKTFSQIGNAVPCKLAYILGYEVFKRLNPTKKKNLTPPLYMGLNFQSTFGF